jgi:hypothetical protein
MAVPSRSTAVGPSTLLAAVPAPRSGLPLPDGADAADTSTREVAGLAWIVREVTHVPGVLRLRAGRLSFESTRRVVFDGTPAELDLELGRSARSGLHVTAAGERLRVCVVRPAGGVPPSRELVDSAADGRPDTTGDADAWAVWQPLLAPEPAAAPARTRIRRFALPRHAVQRSRTQPG